MKERPILMHARSINGILEGRKTQTRRIIKPQPDAHLDPALVVAAWDAGFIDEKCPYGKRGDRLWVRERFLYTHSKTTAVPYAGMDPVEAAGFGAMYGGWKPSIHMPRWASRLTLEVTDIRVERVQDISEVDAKAEGCTLLESLPSGTPTPSYRQAFELLWDDTNGKGAWERNDWCWVVDFRRIP